MIRIVCDVHGLRELSCSELSNRFFTLGFDTRVPTFPRVEMEQLGSSGGK